MLSKEDNNNTNSGGNIETNAIAISKTFTEK